MRYDRGMMLQPVKIEAREGYRIWLRYADGAAGEVDLSDIAGRGVFAVWNDRARFESVRIGPSREITWGGDAELCPDALYLRLAGKALADVMPGARADACDGHRE